MQINEFEIREIVTDEVFKKIQADSFKAIIDRDQSIVLCPCGNGIEVEEGKVDYNVRDDEGNKLTKKAAEHMSKYRIRCNT